MITYRLLSESDFTSLYTCFLEAFSDYEVNMQMPPEQFAKRLARDRVRLEISAGAFDDERMIGFYINGLGEWQGKLTAYDAGTGVVPTHRKRGIGKDLFAFLIPRLKENSVSQYLLEVLTTNEPAVALYRKLGFEETRRLAVLRSNELISPPATGVALRTTSQADWNLFQSFWDWHPSWQNSIAAVERIKDDTLIVEAYVDERCTGYGVLFKPAGNLMQLAVAPRERGKGIGTAIFVALQNEVGEPLKVNNVDEEFKDSLAFYKGLGFEVVLRQFEMMKTLLQD